MNLHLSAQIGTNTNTPESTLDIRVTDPSAPTADAGISIPQLMLNPSMGNRAGQLLINMSDTTFNYFDGSDWLPLYFQVQSIGDLKHGLQNDDHDGWVKLDGRSVVSLTDVQKTNAIALGFIDSILMLIEYYLNQIMRIV